MPVTVVVGAQWGDEGKGKVIDLLAADHPTSCATRAGTTPGTRSSSAGRSSLCTSCRAASSTQHITPVIGNGVVVDPPTLLEEIDTLEGRGTPRD